MVPGGRDIDGYHQVADIIGDDETETVLSDEPRPHGSVGQWPPIRFACVAITGGGEQGTGFFISKSRILTARHVVPDLETLRTRKLLWARFNGHKSVGLNASEKDFFPSPGQLDYTIFTVNPLPDSFCLDVHDISEAVVGESVTVYGNPGGGPLRRSGADSNITSIDQNGHVHYRADALGGDSGGPVLCTRTGKLLAIHLGSDANQRSNRGLLISAIPKEVRA